MRLLGGTPHIIHVVMLFVVIYNYLLSLRGNTGTGGPGPAEGVEDSDGLVSSVTQLALSHVSTSLDIYFMICMLIFYLQLVLVK